MAEAKMPKQEKKKDNKMEKVDNDGLDATRQQIDSIDEQITKLLAQRMDLAIKTRREKERSGKSVEDSSREKNVLQHVEAVAKSEGLDGAVVLRVFEEIMAASKSQQIMDHAPAHAATNQMQPKTIAFQGERGAYSEEALKAAWPNAQPVPCKEFADVFEAVQSGTVDAGLVPIENSTEGSINWTYDLLLNSQLTIAGEKFLRVHHYLLAPAGTQLQAGLNVYSHPQALAQCRDFLHDKGLQAVQYYDTAGAARDLAQGKIETTTPTAQDKNKGQTGGAPFAAAIASRIAAEHYGLTVIAEGIEDNRNNYTRFILISKTAPTPQADFKTSIVFSTQHKPGALFRVLKAFADAGINLTKLESRPTKSTPWEYVFYLDFEGSAFHDPARTVLEQIKPDTLMLKVLGSYPKAK
ncbi:prephenate dehydratase [Candidatus Micrarchaeota archaeon]|nr:prephenate dehydratase [Candidatus Micrarchaeota archaeon]